MQKTAYKVLQEKSNIVAVGAANLPKGQRLLFVRNQPDLGEYEVIGRGMVERSDSKISVIKLEMDDLKKIPQKGDFAVILGEPKTFAVAPTKKPQSDLTIQPEDPEEPERGYFSLGLLSGNGKLASQSSNKANSLKNLDKYPLGGFRFEWFPEFASNYGISYQNASSQVPVVSYYLQTSVGTLSKSIFRIHYRHKKSASNFRWSLFLENQSEEFKTANQDEYVIASRYDSLGVGVHLAWEPGDLLYSTPSILGQPNRLYLEASYAPSVNAGDTTVSRGASSGGSTRMDYSVGYTHVFYWSAIPWLKRYSLDLKYSVSNLDLHFSGATKSETGGFYIIPASGVYSETNTQIQVVFGWRFEDLFGRNFKPR
jgi:hypothetical protein